MKTNKHITMKTKHALCGLLSGLLLLAAGNQAPAALIGVNFGDTTPILPAESAGVVPQINWNNVTTLSAGGLLDDTGSPTAAALSISGAFMNHFGTATAHPDEALNAGQLVQTSGSNFSWTLSGIPYALYNLYVYSLGITAGHVQGITLSGGPTYYTSAPNTSNTTGYFDNNSATPWIYTQATSTNSASPTLNSDYVKFTGLTASSLTVITSSLNSNFRLNGGFQIEAVPEPGTALLLSIGCVGGATLRRRRRA